MLAISVILIDVDAVRIDIEGSREAREPKQCRSFLSKKKHAHTHT